MKQMKQNLSIWKFIRDKIKGGELTTLNDESWEIVRVPHTWNNKDVQSGGGHRYQRFRHLGYYRGEGWYRTWVYVSKEKQKNRVQQFNAKIYNISY